MPVGYVIYKVLNSSNLGIFNSISLFLYRVFFEHKKNCLGRGVEQLFIATYDNYNQITHPDIVCFNGKTYMCATPYTYSNEKVENPCLFEYDSVSDTFVPIGNQPIVKWEKEEFRHHFSDPALLVENNELILFYRNSVHKNKDERLDEIYKILSIDGINWSAPQKIKYSGTAIISPSFCKIGNSVKVYYVVDDNGDTSLFVGQLFDYEIKNSQKVTIKNFHADMCIWHIDVKYVDACFWGLFTFMEHPGEGRTRLYLAKSEDGKDWLIERKITFGQNSNVRNIYKATLFINNNKKTIIASAVDDSFRWYLYRMEMEE
jgi:hypothetical protein